MTRVLLGVRGMDNEAAVHKVTQALLAIPGVTRVSAAADEQASVEYDASEVTVMELIRALRRIGFLAGME